MSDEGQHVQVQTYVSELQREVWREEAEDLDMSQAEYVRTMIQAGRRSFDLDLDDDSAADVTPTTGEPGRRDATPGGETLKTRVLEIIRDEGVADWDELLAGVTENVEDQLDDVLEELQAEGIVSHSGRHGGYTVVDDGR